MCRDNYNVPNLSKRLTACQIQQQIFQTEKFFKTNNWCLKIPCIFVLPCESTVSILPWFFICLCACVCDRAWMSSLCASTSLCLHCLLSWQGRTQTEPPLSLSSWTGWRRARDCAGTKCFLFHLSFPSFFYAQILFKLFLCPPWWMPLCLLTALSLFFSISLLFVLMDSHYS